MSDTFWDFVDILVDCGLLTSRGEAIVLAKVGRSRRLRYGGQLNLIAVLDTCAVRAAHKKFKGR